MEEIYKIALQLGSNSFSVESTDKAWLEQKKNELLELVTEKESMSKGGEQQVTQEEREPTFQMAGTVQEYFNNYVKPINIRSRTNLAVFFVYYLEKIRGEKEIKTSDISQNFGAVGYPNYNKINFTDILSKARRKGYLNNVNNNWTVTLTGEDFVLNKLSDTGSNGSSK